MRTELFQNILATVVYHDEMDFPLTAFEIWKYLIKFPISPSIAEKRGSGFQFSKNYSPAEKGYSLADVTMELESGRLDGFIEKKRGFYFLRGRSDLVGERIRKNKISEEKIKKLLAVIRLLRYVPFVRGASITGRLAAKNAERESDWDVLIVLKAGRIWTGRTLVTLFLHLIVRRRHGKKIKDRVCLNCFVADRSLEMKNQDLFSAREYFILTPVFGEKIFRLFRRENRWIQKYFLHYGAEGENGSIRMIPDTKAARLIRSVGEFFFSWNRLEKFLRHLEKKKIENNPLTRREKSIIEANDERLVFFAESPAKEVISRFEKKMKNLRTNYEFFQSKNRK